MNITVVGIGYVGLSLSVLLSKNNNVIAVDNNISRVKSINLRKPYLNDLELNNHLQMDDLNLIATNKLDHASLNTDYILICVCTDFNTQNESLDTSVIDSILKRISLFNKKAVVIIKSTVPIGYTESARSKYKLPYLFFSPEFLREGKALYDNLYPSRIIVGTPLKDKKVYEYAKTFAKLLQKCSLNEAPILITGLREAESIKLFSNAYLAMRISFFNEIDTFSEFNDVDSYSIIKGIGLDPRIGLDYNNPSFGYGGYCLPKDTKQLLAQFNNIPNKIINAIVESNVERKNFISNQILKLNSSVIGVFRLVMKSNSDNFRESSILDILSNLNEHSVKAIIYEPLLKDNFFMNIPVVNDINNFKKTADVIITNRMSKELSDVSEKIYTRDLFGKD